MDNAQALSRSNKREQLSKGAISAREQRSNAELRREKKPLERPKREMEIYLKNSGADVPC